MLMVDVPRLEIGIRCFEKKRPGRHLPWRRPPLLIWRDRGRLRAH